MDANGNKKEIKEEEDEEKDVIETTKKNRSKKPQKTTTAVYETTNEIVLTQSLDELDLGEKKSKNKQERRIPVITQISYN